MKGLTLTNPYGQLMALGAKMIETRRWKSRYRGPVAIHTAKRFSYEDWFQAAHNPQMWPYLSQAGYTVREKFESQQIIAVGVLVDILPTTGHCPLSGDERYFGDYTEGRYMWIFDQITRLETPIPYVGALGLWEISPASPEYHTLLRQL
jgi:hypothetical protein